jgi:hypothetical protein
MYKLLYTGAEVGLSALSHMLLSGRTTRDEFFRNTVLD